MSILTLSVGDKVGLADGDLLEIKVAGYNMVLSGRVRYVGKCQTVKNNVYGRNY